MLLSLFVISLQLLLKLVVCHNLSSSQVPRNHRMDDVGGRENNNLGESDWGPNSLESFASRFEGYKSSNDFLSRDQVVQQQAGPMFLPLNSSSNMIVRPHLKQSTSASGRWSSAYNHVPEEAIGSVSKASIDTNQSDVVFDDDGDEYSGSNTGSSKVAKSYEISASNLNEQSLSLSEAQRELDESLVVQGKLLSLLNGFRTSSTTSRPKVELKIGPNPMASIRRPTRLMSGILPPPNSVQHPAQRRLAPPGVYSGHHQLHSDSRQQRPAYSRPLVLTTTTTTTNAPLVPPIQAPKDEEDTSYPAIVNPNPDASHNSISNRNLPATRPSHHQNPGGSFQEQESQRDESARWQRFYKHQHQVNPVTMGSVFSFPVESNYLDEELQAEDEEHQYGRLSTGARGQQEPRSRRRPEMASDKWTSMDANEMEQLVLREADLFPSTNGRHRLARPVQHQLSRFNEHRDQSHGLHQPSSSVSHYHTARLSPKSLASNAWYQTAGSSSLAHQDEEELLLRAPAASKSHHQVVHVIESGAGGAKKGHGKYLWPIVGGGLTMLMGFLIISNILLSIPLLAIGASSLLNNNNPLGVTQSQQLVPVYNLSQLIAPPRIPAGRRRRRHAPGLRGHPPESADNFRLPIGATRLSAGELEARLEARALDLTRWVGSLVARAGPVTRAASEALLAAPLRLSRLLDWRGGKLWLGSRQVLKAAYCHRPIKIKQPIVAP